MDGHQKLALQSKQWLEESLFELMKTQSYDNISVKEIAEAAKLSRRTFYRSFQDKNELLYFYIDNLTNEYLASLNQLSGQTLGFEDVMKYFFSFWWNHRERTQILIHQGIFNVITTRMSKQSNNLYELFSAPWHIDGSKEDVQNVLTFFFGGLWSILEHWLAEDNPEDYNKLANTLMNSMKIIGNIGKF